MARAKIDDRPLNRRPDLDTDQTWVEMVKETLTCTARTAVRTAADRVRGPVGLGGGEWFPASRAWARLATIGPGPSGDVKEGFWGQP